MFKNIFAIIVSLVSTFFVFIFINNTYAATTPDLGTTSTFGVLSSTFTRNIGVTAIVGDLGYTTLSGSGTHTVTGSTYVPSPAQAGTDQASALSSLALEPCTFTFVGVLHLNSDTTHGPVGIYTPGVYCSTGAMDIAGGGTITLSGSGTYIFRSGGALDSTAGSIVALSGASACDVFWTPTGATTLGANSTFKGTVIDDAGITVGNTVDWVGRALAFGGTVTTDTDTVTVPTCTVPTASPTPSPSPSPSPSPTATAVATQTPSPSPSTTSSEETLSVSSSTSNFCPELNNQIVPPNIIESIKVDKDSIFLSWGPYSVDSQFNIRYGPQNGNWIYSTDVTGFYTTINSIPVGEPIWFQVANRNSCMIGEYGTAYLVNPQTSPNTSIPGFPNTGMDPSK